MLWSFFKTEIVVDLVN